MKKTLKSKDIIKITHYLGQTRYVQAWSDKVQGEG